MTKRFFAPGGAYYHIFYESQRTFEALYSRPSRVLCHDLRLCIAASHRDAMKCNLVHELQFISDGDIFPVCKAFRVTLKCVYSLWFIS